MKWPELQLRNSIKWIAEKENEQAWGKIERCVDECGDSLRPDEVIGDAHYTWICHDLEDATQQDAV